MADIKFQAVRGNTPSDHVDFRGDGFRGSPDDEHRTIAERRVNDPQQIELILGVAPKANAALDLVTQDQPEAFQAVATALGLKGSGPVRLQLRVYDND